MAKLKRKAFKAWLDALAAAVVKTRDGFTCQINRPGCAGRMTPGDYNCQWCHIISRTANKTRWELLNAVTGCGHCHQWAHSHPVDFGLWYANKYPYRFDYLRDKNQEPNRTWRASDFEEVEEFLLGKAVDLNVDYLNISKRYRDRFKRKIEEKMFEA